MSNTLKYLLIFISAYANAAIVPEELPSLLSVAYSNIPPIKKGTDSRVGFGFSLGNHADFQVVFELGPQSNTNPIGTSYASSSKRHIRNRPKKTTQRNKAPESDGSNYLAGWSQNMKQKPKTEKPFAPLPIPQEETQPENPLGTINLLELLSKMRDGQQPMEGTILKQPDPTNMPSQALNQLKKLYGTTDTPKFVPRGTVEATNKPASEGNFKRLAQFNVNEDKRSEAEKKKITAELSDVSLDDDE